MPSHPRARQEPQHERSSGERDGVRVVETSVARKVMRVTLVAMGVVVLSVIAALIGLRARAARLAEPPTPPADVARAPAAARVVTSAVPPGATLPVVPPQPPAAPRAASPRRIERPAAPAAGPPAQQDAPFTIGGPDDTSGIRAFPPMGSKPVKRGLIVPDDFELPPGYVRHFQSTDDGERLPAILMFSPDYEWVDAQGRRVDVPADRIVPPELAPPGLAIRMLEAPASPPDRRP